jgi:MOSC domain-containing protein YiiM
MAFQLVGVQGARARKIHLGGRLVASAIHKTALTGPAPVGPLGLVDDEQADLSVHGGLSKAVYAFPAAHYPFWRDARVQAGAAGLEGGDDALAFGSLGENLTISGLVEADVWIGDVLQFPDCALRVTDPREPCSKFNAAMGFSGASKLMAQTGYCGFYLAVDTPGSVQVGQGFELLAGPRQMGIPERFKARMFKHLR